MDEASERDETSGREPAGATSADRFTFPADGGTRKPADAPKDPGDGGHHHRWHRHGGTGPHRPTGLAESLVTSGGMLLAMVEDVRMRGGTQPEDLRTLADTFARHCAAKEATVRKALDRHHEAALVVRRDRQEGDLIQGILDRAVTGRHPEDTRHLTVDGALTQMYQYLSHERRDLVPALERAVPEDESETLAAAFEAIGNG